MKTLTLWIAVVVVIAIGASAQDSKLKTYQSKYYVIHSDLDEATVRDAENRITAMAEEYHSRTRGFAGTITKRLPFYLYSKPEDYHAAGGVQGSAGVFNGEKLMAIFSKQMGSDVWRVVQHEGFHQFVSAVIGGEIPIWVNEGMAEYFGESVFTGDGYITGVVPPQRLARIKLWIREGHTVSISHMMNMAHETWNARLTIVDYDQAWSMIYFLAHAQNGRYQEPLNKFIKSVSGGTSGRDAWTRIFGGANATREFEKQWKDYWESLDAAATADKFAEATVATITSHFARAYAQRQFFTLPEDFFKAAQAGMLKMHKDDWLPGSLLEREFPLAAKLAKWTFIKRSTGMDVQCEVTNGPTLIGSFKVTTAKRVKSGSVQVATKRR